MTNAENQFGRGNTPTLTLVPNKVEIASRPIDVAPERQHSQGLDPQSNEQSLIDDPKQIRAYLLGVQRAVYLRMVTTCPQDGNTSEDINADNPLGSYFNSMGTWPLLEKDEEIALSKVIQAVRATRKDSIKVEEDEPLKLRLIDANYEPEIDLEDIAKQAKELFMSCNLRLAVHFATKFCKDSGFDQRLENFIDAGNEGLDKAIDRFDWRKGCRFSTYAAFWIRRDILRLIKKQSSELDHELFTTTGSMDVLANDRDFNLETGLNGGKYETLQDIENQVAAGQFREKAKAVLDSEQQEIFDLLLDGLTAEAIAVLVDKTGPAVRGIKRKIFAIIREEVQFESLDEVPYL